MKLYIKYLIFLLSYSCILNKSNPSEQIKNIKDTALVVNSKNDEQSEQDIENEISDSIANLPEVKSYFSHLGIISKGKVHGVLMIKKKSNGEEPFYKVEVGNTAEGRFVTKYIFVVYKKKKLEIKFFDTMNDSIITLQEWRRVR